ncbi:MAG: xanthine dehydrogenase accessory factor [Solirubrobacteraceae bacterium]|nr:xanthine dehydrogenase accessory factor [Solirubrobacteraceae bacterium]
MIRAALEARADALAAARTPFVVATVVRRQRPTSVRAGDTALVLTDGTIEGFVGGSCAEESVRLHALRVLETGEPLLLRIVPEAPPGSGVPDVEGEITVANPCLSGGALELFLEPRVPAPRVVVVGDTPVAVALAELGVRVGLGVEGGEPAADDLALVVASHGRDEPAVLEQALRDHVSYVGLVASRRRGAAVVASLDVADDLRARVRTPAGLDIGAYTAEEIALSILAEVIDVRRRRMTGPAPADAPAPAGPATAVDPVCGMEVAVTAATARAEHAGTTVFFCCEGCRDRFAADPLGHARAH